MIYTVNFLSFKYERLLQQIMITYWKTLQKKIIVYAM